MARITTNRNATGSAPIRDPNASPRVETSGYNSAIAQQVINSPAYQSALQVLSAESDKSWLQRLEMIPYSVDDAAQTFLDNIGLSSSFQDKQDANYQYCMEQISALMTEYQTWKNSLPVNQVQQMADAGINSAITGANIAGSSIPNVGVSTDPSQVRSVDPIQAFGSAVGTAVDFIMTPVNGFADLAVKFRQLRQTDRLQNFNEQSALLEFYKYATENGYVVDTNILNGSFGDLFKYDSFQNPKGDRISSEEVLKGFLSHHVNSPLYSGLAQLYPNLVHRFKIEGDDRWFTDTGFAPVPVGLSSVVESQLAMYRNEERYRLLFQKYQKDIASYDVDTAEYNSIRAQYDKDYQGYIKEKQRITLDLINRLAKSKNEDDMLLLSKILLGYNYDDIDILNAAADGAEVRQVTGAIGDVVGGAFTYSKVSK